MTKTGDVGLEVVKGIFELLEIDDEWSSWNDRGFEWWGYNLRQRVWATRGYDDDGITIYRIFVVSDTVRNVNKPQHEVDVLLSRLNSLAVGSAMIFDPSEKRLQSWTAATVHEESANWLTRLLTSYTILQAILASSRAESIAEMVDGEVDSSGDREEADEMFSVLEAMFLPKGQEPSPWQGSSEHVQIRDMLNQSNCVSTGSENGLTAEFQFGDNTSMMQVITDDPNPIIGSGVGMFLQLPMWGTFEDASMIAGALNRAEANNKAVSHLFGSWCAKTVGEQSIPAFALFIPSALHQPGLLTNLVISSANRAGWAGRLLNPDADPADVNSIIMDRLGAMATPNEV